jgi:hypothetical protein
MSVLNEAGEEMLAEAGRSTPLRIELPPGVYSVVLGSPSLAEPTVCQTEVVAEQSARCMAAVDPVDVSDYFREMGWWR